MWRLNQAAWDGCTRVLGRENASASNELNMREKGVTGPRTYPQTYQ
jgi:hypothetical protein